MVNSGSCFQIHVPRVPMICNSLLHCPRIMATPPTLVAGADGACCIFPSDKRTISPPVFECACTSIVNGLALPPPIPGCFSSCGVLICRIPFCRSRGSIVFLPRPFALVVQTDQICSRARKPARASRTSVCSTAESKLGLILTHLNQASPRHCSCCVLFVTKNDMEPLPSGVVCPFFWPQTGNMYSIFSAPHRFAVSQMLLWHD